MMYPLKPLSKEAIPAALAKAERYRLLNEPEQAESICEDILAADPANREAVVILLLALTDRFPRSDGHLVSRAQELAAHLLTPYERAYFSGLVAERRGRSLLDRGGPGRAFSAGDWLREAMQQYELAEDHRPQGNDEARLRWNACARVLNSHPELAAADYERTAPLMLE